MSEYKEDLKIDFSKLDINWRDFPTDYLKWSQEWVNAVANRDRSKEVLEVLRAELDGKYRIELQLGSKKPTEAAISAAIIQDEDYQEAQQALINATENMNTMAVVKMAFDHKKKALEGITHLWLGGYYSDPKIPAEIKQKYEKNTKEDQIKKLNKNPRLQKRKVAKPKKKNK